MSMPVKDLMHQESFECEKLVSKKFNASVLFAINERELSIYRFPTSDTQKDTNWLFLVKLQFG